MENNPKRPLISVVMPLYNAERFVGESIESLMAQTLSDFELIVIDDCSTDGSAAVVEELQRRDPRIKLLRNERNLGAASTRNRGLDAARGEFIAFLDADDICIPERFEKQIAFLKAHPGVDVCGSYYLIFNDQSDRDHGHYDRLPLTPEEIRCQIFFFNPLGMSTIMLRADALRKTGIQFRNCVCEDYKLWADLSDRLTMANIPECLIRYRQWEEQTSARHQQRQVESALEIQRELLARRTGIVLSDDEARRLSRFIHQPELVERGDLPFFRQFLSRFHQAYRQRESYRPKHFERMLRNRFICFYRRFNPSWKVWLQKRLFRIALLFH